MYAIVKTGGKQYRVEQGQTLLVERLPQAEGDTVSLEPLLVRSEETIFDAAGLAKVAVEATIVNHLRGPKLRVFKFKPKRGYRRRTGHRQELTRIEVTRIGAAAAASAPKRVAEAAPKPAAAPKPPAAVEAAASTVEPATAAKPAAARKPPAPVEAAATAAEPTAVTEAKPAAKPATTRKPAAAKPEAAAKPAASRAAAKEPGATAKPAAARKPATADEPASATRKAAAKSRKAEPAKPNSAPLKKEDTDGS
ncbi:MAG: 50S ribosomal protein L21 [Solirubrobacteraceae bacterium]|jgi:large subunit ribosomal protein L21